MEYWTNLYIDKSGDYTHLDRAPFVSRDDAIQDVGECQCNDFRYLHTLYIINGIARMIDLLPLLAEDELNAKLDLAHIQAVSAGLREMT